MQFGFARINLYDEPRYPDNYSMLPAREKKFRNDSRVNLWTNVWRNLNLNLNLNRHGVRVEECVSQTSIPPPPPSRRGWVGLGIQFAYVMRTISDVHSALFEVVLVASETRKRTTGSHIIEFLYPTKHYYI